MSDAETLAKYLNGEQLGELLDSWTAEGFQEDDPRILEIKKALEIVA